MHAKPLRTPVPAPPMQVPAVPFQFGVDFQAKLVKVLLLDDGTGDVILDHVKPDYFENPQLRWVVQNLVDYRKEFNQTPTITVLMEQARGLDASMRAIYTQAVDHIRQLPVKEEAYIQKTVLEWVKRNIFVEAHQASRHLFNENKITEAYDAMRTAMDEIEQTIWRKMDRGWYFEELAQREGVRSKINYAGEKIGSGIAQLDKTLGGGLGPGEMGVWIAYSKGGKSVMLLNHGVNCTRGHFKKCLHFVLEGSRKQVEDRYDSCFSSELYAQLKTGKMDPALYAQLHQEFQYLKNLLVIRGLVDNWDNNIHTIDQELQDLRRQFGWIPDMIVIDYGDLLEGRKGPYDAPWMSDRDAYRDQKTLANRGFVVWTAAQAQRPKVKDYKNVEHVLFGSDIAGGMDKIRVADFIGSINSTNAERDYNLMRINPELYRDAPGGDVFTVGADFSRMRFGLPPEANNVLGYGQFKDSKAKKK